MLLGVIFFLIIIFFILQGILMIISISSTESSIKKFIDLPDDDNFRDMMGKVKNLGSFSSLQFGNNRNFKPLLGGVLDSIAVSKNISYEDKKEFEKCCLKIGIRARKNIINFQERERYINNSSQNSTIGYNDEMIKLHLERTKKLAEIEPTSSIAASRQFVEEVINSLILIHNIDVEEFANGIDEADSLFSKIRIIKDSGILPVELHDDVENIRIIGNRASHGEIFTEEDSNATLELANIIFNWYSQNYNISK
jgi:hypothetical protein